MPAVRDQATASLFDFLARSFVCTNAGESYARMLHSTQEGGVALFQTGSRCHVIDSVSRRALQLQYTACRKSISCPLSDFLLLHALSARMAPLVSLN